MYLPKDIIFDLDMVKAPTKMMHSLDSYHKGSKLNFVPKNSNNMSSQKYLNQIKDLYF